LSYSLSTLARISSALIVEKLREKELYSLIILSLSLNTSINFIALFIAFVLYEFKIFYKILGIDLYIILPHVVRGHADKTGYQHSDCFMAIHSVAV